MQHRALDYAIDYLGRDGRKRGQEICHVTVHRNGDRTLRARSEIFDSEVLRDVVYTVDAAYRPLDCSVRVSLRDDFVGSGWFHFAADHAECETWTAAHGRISQMMPLDGPAVSFISHAVSGDVWHGACLAASGERGPRLLAPLLTCSPLHNGSSGPYLGRWPLRATLLEPETIETPVGVFAAEHVRYEEPTGELFLDTWCTADGDRVMLRMHYPPYESSYVLRSLVRSGALGA